VVNFQPDNPAGFSGLYILNKELKNNDYYGYIISPNDYDEFFTEVIRNKNYRYISKFHKELEKIK